MTTLDQIDRKILYQLDINARQSHSQIGRKIHVHKNVVRYRINKLLENGVIKNFYTVIDAFKLGYISLKFLLSFHYASQKTRNEIIYFIQQNKSIWYIAEVEGSFDIVINFWIKNFHQFHRYWKKILEQYRENIDKIQLSIYTQTHHFPESHLLGKKYSLNDRKQYEVINAGKAISIDDIDQEILQIISLQARISLVDIAKKLQTTTTVIQYRLKKLQKQKIIQAFKVNIDIGKLGLQYYTININLNDYTKRDEIYTFIKMNPFVKMIDVAIGGSDLIIGVRAYDVLSIHSLIKEIDKKYSNAIKNYNYYYFLNIKKMSFIPTP